MILGAVQVVSSVVGLHTSKGTFLSLAAPVPERMASIKACLAFTELLGVPVLNLETVTEAEGAWGAGAGGGGRAGGGGPFLSRKGCLAYAMSYWMCPIS